MLVHEPLDSIRHTNQRSITRDLLHPRKRLKYPTPHDNEICPIVPGKRETVTCDVVIPFEDSSPDWLSGSVESILNQNYAQPIIHLVADGQTNKSVIQHALHEFVHPNIRIYQSRTKLGPHRLTNCLFDFFETDFLCIQDSDDIATPNRIWRSVSVLQATKSDIFGAVMEQFIDYRHQSEGTQEQLRVFPYFVTGTKWHNIPDGSIIHGSMTLTCGFFEEINGYADLDATGDCELVSRAWAANANVYLSEQVVALRRLRSDSLSHGTSQERLQEIDAQILAAIKSFPEDDFDPFEYGSLDTYRSALDIIKLK
jgi:glycosyltransferase involved in cell wall biosynthesis